MPGYSRTIRELHTSGDGKLQSKGRRTVIWVYGPVGL